MSTYRTWEGATKALARSFPPPNGEQKLLAAGAGVRLDANDPGVVVAARLCDALAERLELRAAFPASERQIAYLRALANERLAARSLDKFTRRVASAWIHYLLAHRNIALLRELEVERGDLVSCQRPVYDYYGSRSIERTCTETHVVSSISDSGRVNFKRTLQPLSSDFMTPARSAWPSALAVVAREVVAAPSDMHRFGPP